MKVLLITLVTASLALYFCPMPDLSNTKISETDLEKNKDSVLRHVVLFKFKEGTPANKISEIETAFRSLPAKIPEIASLEWGLNNSPEGLEKGFTHCFLLTFNSEQDRTVYLPHADHKAFGALLTPHLEDVLVVDYWTH
ncbi:Dabb family protein [Spongiimicrobium sp. 3-5]|uniref:Dabb family protein n=1 Tax=Spongiimicrobium sp. 3-5 TaxID=3332596 RepID=UPI00397FFFB3